MQTRGYEIKWNFFPLFNIQLNFAFSTKQTTFSLQRASSSYADIHQGWEEVRQESAIHSHVKTEHLCRYKQDNSVAGLQRGTKTASSSSFYHSASSLQQTTILCCETHSFYTGEGHTQWLSQHAPKYHDTCHRYKSFPYSRHKGV
jgi:hypothetical protein